VFFDPSDADDIFRRNPQRLPLLVRLVRGEPEMHDPIADDDVLRSDPRPLLAAKLGEKSAADRAVVGLALTRHDVLDRPAMRFHVIASEGQRRSGRATTNGLMW
jgi:hypothetical protein